MCHYNKDCRMKISRNKFLSSLLLSFLVSLLTTACTHNAPPPTINDPYEHLNRKIYSVNTRVDHAVLRPIARAYNKIIPAPAQTGVTNFFANIHTLTTIPNDLLQGKLVFAMSDSWRFIVNSTVGIGGLIDVASRTNLPKHEEDFGLTLAYWGITKQSYIMLPLLGPSTPRDTVGLAADYAMSPWPYVHPWWTTVPLFVLKTVNLRASLLPADALVDNSFDPYVFIRDAYTQERAKQIADNKLTYDEYFRRSKEEQAQESRPSASNTIGANVATMATIRPAAAQRHLAAAQTVNQSSTKPETSTQSQTNTAATDTTTPGASQ